MFFQFCAVRSRGSQETSIFLLEFNMALHFTLHLWRLFYILCKYDVRNDSVFFQNIELEFLKHLLYHFSRILACSWFLLASCLMLNIFTRFLTAQILCMFFCDESMLPFRMHIKISTAQSLRAFLSIFMFKQ